MDSEAAPAPRQFKVLGNPCWAVAGPNLWRATLLVSGAGRIQHRRRTAVGTCYMGKAQEGGWAVVIDWSRPPGWAPVRVCRYFSTRESAESGARGIALDEFVVALESVTSGRPGADEVPSRARTVTWVAAPRPGREEARRDPGPDAPEPESLIIPGRPVPFAIEAIGDNVEELVRDTRRVLRSAGVPEREIRRDAPTIRPVWVAEIAGRSKRYGLARRFLKGQRDYEGANSIGSRGILVRYYLQEGGWYEISAPWSWRKIDRYFAEVVGGKIARRTREEVDAWLENLAESGMEVDRP